MDDVNPKHILVVEDSIDLQYLLSEVFLAEGYSVSQAYNGEEALTCLRSTGPLPALILLDIMMPIMDGLEFRDEQKKDPHFAGIPVVVMSADSNSSIKAEQMAAAGYIRKPIGDVGKLLETIEECRFKGVSI